MEGHHTVTVHPYVGEPVVGQQVDDEIPVALPDTVGRGHDVMRLGAPRQRVGVAGLQSTGPVVEDVEAARSCR